MRSPWAAWMVILAGVGAAMHVGKLPPALPVLQAELGLSLLEAGFLLSLVQMAGMTLGVVTGAMADGLGLRRSMCVGLFILSIASALGGLSHDPVILLTLRALEGLGFLLTTMPAPGLIRRLVPTQRLSPMLGWWGAYMPLGTALALLAGPLAIEAWGWTGLWTAMAVLSLGLVAGVLSCIPPDTVEAVRAPAGALRLRLGQTLSASGPWLIGGAFAMYSSQWLAVVGFLPSIYAAGGLAGTAVAWMTAMAAAANMMGNIGAGRLLQRGVQPPLLLACGFAFMALSSLLAFQTWVELPFGLRYGLVIGFSMVGGLIPGTLFSLAVRLSPQESLVSTTVGWMQQCSSMGQFAGPPLVAWVAASRGGWAWTGLTTATFALGGMLLSFLIARRLALRG